MVSWRFLCCPFGWRCVSRELRLTLKRTGEEWERDLQNERKRDAYGRALALAKATIRDVAFGLRTIRAMEQAALAEDLDAPPPGLK